MQGPAAQVRSGDFPGYENQGPLYEWVEGKAYLLVDRVSYQGHTGAIFTYTNPPVHQMGNPALQAYLEGFQALEPLREELRFVILYGACDPVHAGGDLKESMTRLQDTLKQRKELEAQGASAAQVDALYSWGDARIERGFALYKAVRQASETARTVAVCSGGTRFGGSAEVVLMADVLVGDSRAAMCFSESMIGLIPGWGGVGRAITKAGLENARHMAGTCPVVKAPDLQAIGLLNQVVAVDRPFPKKQRTDDPAADKQQFLQALQENNDETGRLLLPAALALAVAEDVPRLQPGERKTLATADETAAEVARRRDPKTYEGLWGKSLKEAGDALKVLGRPLAPQSVHKLEELLATVDPASFDEEAFIRAEGETDGELYRDPRFMEGILATLDQRVADFREAR